MEAVSSRSWLPILETPGCLRTQPPFSDAVLMFEKFKPIPLTITNLFLSLIIFFHNQNDNNSNNNNGDDNNNNNNNNNNKMSSTVLTTF